MPANRVSAATLSLAACLALSACADEDLTSFTGAIVPAADIEAAAPPAEPTSAHVVAVTPTLAVSPTSPLTPTVGPLALSTMAATVVRPVATQLGADARLATANAVQATANAAAAELLHRAAAGASATAAAIPTVPATPTTDPYRSMGAPVRIEIPSIGVNAYIEQVGLTRDRAMDVPSGWMNAGWYRHGSYPGEPGNAVIAGHLDTNTGSPAVFWDLDKMVPGDEVIVTFHSGTRLTFRTENSGLFPFDESGPAIKTIFGPSLTSDLNLITCNGAWDHGQKTYKERLVVFTTLMPEKTVHAGGAAPIP
jgi:hypothetical protein